MNKGLPAEYQEHLATRTQPLLRGRGRAGLTLRGFWVGCFLSFFLAIGAPYGNMIIRGTYMALDISTPGAIFLFLVLIGALNVLFKLAGRSSANALALVLLIGTGWLWAHWPLAEMDPYSPGVIFSTFMLVCALINLPLAGRGRGLALNRAELILVYAMLLMVSALCTMGLSEQILPMITAAFYYASPENGWREKLFPHFPERPVMVDDGARNTAFYEGVAGTGQDIPYGAWVEPLMWWGVFLLALYVTMISIAVILRRQWMERERLPYPLAQVGLAMIRGEDEKRLVNGFFRQRSMWIGCALPLLVGSLLALHRYDSVFPAPGTVWNLSFIGRQNLQLRISFAMIGFSYFINTKVAASIWAFHLISKIEKEILALAGLKSSQLPFHGVPDAPLIGYQGLGALLCMVLVGLWVGREHLRNVLFKALGWAPEVDDGDEIISYRGAVVGTGAGIATMVAWLVLMGTLWWVALLFIVLALLIFIGITRIITEAGLAALRAPMNAPDFIVHGLGSTLVGTAGVFNLSLAYIWSAEVRAFVMATCANALKLIDELDRSSRRVLFWAILLALLIGALGSFWMIFHMAYRHGGINLNGWFFKRMNEVAYNNALRHFEPAGVYWPGMAFFAGGGGIMGLLMWARQRLPWWPLHPIGFTIGGTGILETVSFSVFLAWAFKSLILRFGGARLFQRSQPFFLGLISGHMLCNGMWLVIDYFTGKIGNPIFGF